MSKYLDKNAVQYLWNKMKDYVDSHSCGSGNGFTYSSAEQWTGEYWVNGKKIYQKTLQLNCSAMGGGFEFGDEYGFLDKNAIEEIIGLDGNFHQTSGEIFPLNGGWLSGTANFYCYAYIGSDMHIRIANTSSGRYDLHIRYTKKNN